MKTMVTAVLFAVMAALTGCVDMGRIGVPEDVPTWVYGESKFGGPCEPFSVYIHVPKEEAGAELSKYGDQKIRQGCSPNFHEVFAPGSRPGTLSIIFEGETPFIDSKGSEVKKFRAATARSLFTRSVDDGVCTELDPCKYSIVHRVPETGEESPYPEYDPFIIITQ